jgi:hypothetical protein
MGRDACTGLIIMSLAVTAAFVLLVEARHDAVPRESSQEFQRVVGGLGLGAAIDLEGCPCSFDPRLADVCSKDWGPVPGGLYFCPHHAFSVFPWRPSLKEAGGASREAKRHGETP